MHYPARKPHIQHVNSLPTGKIIIPPELGKLLNLDWTTLILRSTNYVHCNKYHFTHDRCCNQAEFYFMQEI